MIFNSQIFNLQGLVEGFSGIPDWKETLGIGQRKGPKVKLGEFVAKTAKVPFNSLGLPKGERL